jgi:hypothetical protein
MSAASSAAGPNGQTTLQAEVLESTVVDEALLVRLLRRLSTEFVADTIRAREPDCPPPWTTTSVINRDEVSRKVSNAFRALMMSKEPAT